MHFQRDIFKYEGLVTQLIIEFGELKYRGKSKMVIMLFKELLWYTIVICQGQFCPPM